MIKVSSIKCKDCTFEAVVEVFADYYYTAKVVKLPQNTLVWTFKTGRLSEARQLAEDSLRKLSEARQLAEDSLRKLCG